MENFPMWELTGAILSAIAVGMFLMALLVWGGIWLVVLSIATILLLTFWSARTVYLGTKVGWERVPGYPDDF